MSKYCRCWLALRFIIHHHANAGSHHRKPPSYTPSQTYTLYHICSTQRTSIIAANIYRVAPRLVFANIHICVYAVCVCFCCCDVCVVLVVVVVVFVVWVLARHVVPYKNKYIYSSLWCWLSSTSANPRTIWLTAFADIHFGRCSMDKCVRGWELWIQQ